jgi:hypothetical protein
VEKTRKISGGFKVCVESPLWFLYILSNFFFSDPLVFTILIFEQNVIFHTFRYLVWEKKESHEILVVERESLEWHWFSQWKNINLDVNEFHSMRGVSPRCSSDLDLKLASPLHEMVDLNSWSFVILGLGTGF